MTDQKAALRAGKLAHLTGYPVFSRRWNPDDGIPDLSGKVALVTGGNTGLGLVTCEHLLKHNISRVYLAARSEQRAKDAIAELTRLCSLGSDDQQRLVWLPFDLTDIDSIDRAARTVLSDEKRLDILVNNAGIMACPYELKNGVEVQFWNHLGHFVLVDKLLPLMKQAAREHGNSSTSVRIVNVSSMGHTFSPQPAFESIDAVNRPLSSTWARYGQSKLANILFTNELKKRLEGDSIRVFSCHPGNVHTTLTRGPIASSAVLGNIMKAASSVMAMSPLEGTKTQLWAATSPEIDELDLNGDYLMPIASIGVPSKYARDEKYARDLWELSERFVRDHRQKSKL